MKQNQDEIYTKRKVKNFTLLGFNHKNLRKGQFGAKKKLNNFYLERGENTYSRSPSEKEKTQSFLNAFDYPPNLLERAIEHTRLIKNRKNISFSTPKRMSTSHYKFGRGINPSFIHLLILIHRK
jgi:hypothetical protein